MSKREETNLTKRFFVGAITSPRTDWERFYAEPEVPTHLKPETAAKKVQEKREAQRQNVGRAPIGAFLHSVHIINAAGDVLFQARANPDVPSAASVMLPSRW